MAKRGPRAATSGTGNHGTRQIRCAIYTRKSTEEGLDQAFNSLDAQREACAAYILSQRHEGWAALPAVYDDGGYSGGTMERPALKRLLADVEAGGIDVIVVYKVDRLTRALSDFAKIVEILDARGASFVSVTQASNTTTSMGRLTLNVLLSFAQFEREVTGERIRDKIAASKKKGMWMGGPVPLGYDVVERKLIVNDAEAATVAFIFERFVALQSLNALAADLVLHGVCSKHRTMRDGRQVGGQAFRAGALGHLLRNVLYTGRVSHGDQIYEGEHQAILPRELWDEAQTVLSGNAPRPHTGESSLLSGRLVDEHGQPMSTEHANKAGRRYRYYVSRTDAVSATRAWRIPAGDLDAIVGDGIRRFLNDPQRVAAELGCQPAIPQQFAQRCTSLAEQAMQPAALRSIIQRLDTKVEVTPTAVTIAVEHGALANRVGCETIGADQPVIRLAQTITLKRRGHEFKLVYAAPEERSALRDERLIQLLASGRVAFEQLKAGQDDATNRRHLTRLARLRFLAPDIVTAILEGRQPTDLTSRSLLRVAELPAAWPEQRTMLGFS